MILLQIEHQISNFKDWKIAFDSDPIDRKACGVKHYLVFRPVDDPNYVIIHLGFEDLVTAQETLKKLQILWHGVEGSLMINPVTRFLDIADALDL